MDDFLLRALIGGVGIALVSAPLGCFVVWRRMAYFGATLSHAALLGVALGLLLNIDVRVGVLGICVLVAGILYVLRKRRNLAMDTLLGILAHGALAVGLVVLAFMDNVRVDLMSYLFGDVLAIGDADLAWIWGGGAGVVAVLVLQWRSLLMVTLNPDLARVEGTRVELLELIFLLLVSVVVAVAMQVVGLLLIVSMLIIPPAVARPWASTPEIMVLGAAIVGIVAVIAGLGASLSFDVPAGPAIVTVAMTLFALSLFVSNTKRTVR